MDSSFGASSFGASAAGAVAGASTAGGGVAGASVAVVAGELVAAADVLAGHFAALSGPQWLRPGRRSDGASFTVETFGRYFIHDPIHHLHDVTVTP